MGSIKPTEIFNLLITLQGHKDATAGEEFLGREEISMALQAQERELNFKESGFPNVILIDLNMDPYQAVDLLRNNPTTVISKVVPIEAVARTRLDTILEKVLILAGEKLSPENSFRVICDLRGRKYINSPQDLIEVVSTELSEKLNGRINEKNPEWVVQLEVIGENTGLSVLRPGDILKKI